MNIDVKTDINVPKGDDSFCKYKLFIFHPKVCRMDIQIHVGALNIMLCGRVLNLLIEICINESRVIIGKKLNSFS